jgi:mutual gliding-motility protein MglA
VTFINYPRSEINCKVVYDGPHHGGKVENVHFIYEKTHPANKSELRSLATEYDQTLFFHFLAEALGNVRGFKTRLHVYAIPGQAFYRAARRKVLEGVDGVIFVADSQLERMDANVESLRQLQTDLEALNRDLRTLPYVLQLNKRDSESAVPIDDMKAALCLGTEPVVQALAHSREGSGVFDALKSVLRMILEDLTKST